MILPFSFFTIGQDFFEVDRRIGFSALMKPLSVNKRSEREKRKKLRNKIERDGILQNAKCYKGIIIIFQFRIYDN